MPGDPVIERQEVVPGAFGAHDHVVTESHVAPLSTEIEGMLVEDPHKAADKALAKHVYAFLKTRFPIEYDWFVEADAAQGIVKFNIPMLMNLNHVYVINLRTCGSIGEAVVNGAGELLERFLLPRDKFNLGAILEARCTKSTLVHPWMKVPE
jgi:hypothetical protein